MSTHQEKSMLKQIELTKLKPHPKNPRLIVREDVVSAIMTGINESIDAPYALQVWPTKDEYFILSGHHRAEAAKRKGLKTVPCFVMSDLNEDEAYMVLATANAQGELSPLEIGMHALNYVEKASGGRGLKGGLSEYAEKLGKAKQNVVAYRDAAEVAINCHNDMTVLLDKAAHLAAIHGLPESCWQAAVERLLKKGWSAKETQEQVKAAKKGQTDKQIAALFLNKTSIKELQRISDLKNRVGESLSYEDLKKQWVEWCEENDPIDIKAVQTKRVELEDIEADRKAKEQEKLDEQEQIQIELAKQKLPSLVLADPPWQYNFSETDSRQIENQYPSATVDEIIEDKPETQPDCVLFLWATAPKLLEALEVMENWGFTYKTHGVWDKKKIGMGYWFRGQHELLLVGTKGQISPPDPENREGSVFEEVRQKHSVKPECVYTWIEKAFPKLKKLEMYSRNPRSGWEAWGNEAK